MFSFAENYVCVNTTRYDFVPIKNLPGIFFLSFVIF